MFDLFDKYYSLSKIKELQNNSFDNIWNIVYKQYKRDTDEVKTDKKKSIDKYLQKLQKIVYSNDKELSDTVFNMRFNC